MGAAKGLESEKEAEAEARLFPLADDVAKILEISGASVGDAGVEESHKVASC